MTAKILEKQRLSEGVYLMVLSGAKIARKRKADSLWSSGFTSRGEDPAHDSGCGSAKGQSRSYSRYAESRRATFLI